VDDDEGEENIPSITIPDVVFFDMVSEEEKKYYEDNPIPLDKVEDMKIQCTACWKQVNHRIPNNIQRHPQLGVPICRNCKHFYEDGDWEKDDEGSDMYCRWCGNGGEVLGCDKCKVYVYCKQCITRNCGRAKFAEINESEEWACFACEPSQIYKERSQMLALARWAAERKKLKRKCGGRKETPKKKKEDPEKVKENRKRKREETQKRKLEEEIGKLESFIDENIHEAFDTLAIYQKCLEDERRKWIRVRKSMNANNAATAAKSLRRIYEITKQNMELLDHSLVEGYKAVFPDEGQKKLKFTTDPKPSPKPSPNKHGQTNKQTNMAAKQRTKEVRNESVDMDDDIEVEGIVLNGEAVYANGEDGGGMGDFDPSLLCSVEISTGRDSDSCSTPTPRTPRQPLKKKMKLNKSVTKSPSSGPVPSHGRIKISNKFLKKKPKSTPIKMKPTKRKAEDDDDIEEITIDDDEDSVSYVSQPVLAKKSLKKQRLSEDDDDNFDSDVSLE